MAKRLGATLLEELHGAAEMKSKSYIGLYSFSQFQDDIDSTNCPESSVQFWD